MKKREQQTADIFAEECSDLAGIKNRKILGGYNTMSVLEKLTEGIVRRDVSKGRSALLKVGKDWSFRGYYER